PPQFNAPLKSARRRACGNVDNARVAHSPTGKQNRKKRTFDVLPKPDKFIRYRQILSCSPPARGLASRLACFSLGARASQRARDRIAADIVVEANPYPSAKPVWASAFVGMTASAGRALL